MPHTVAIGMLCMSCQRPIEVGEGLICPTCNAPHHRECWRRIGQCASPNCPSRRPVTLGQVLPPSAIFSVAQLGAVTMCTPVEFSLRAVLATGWSQALRFLLNLMTGNLVIALIVTVLCFIPFGPPAILLLLPALHGGLCLVSLHAVNDRPPEINDLFSGFRHYFNWAGLYLTLALIGLACLLPSLAVLAISILAEAGEIVPGALFDVDWRHLSTVELISLLLFMIFAIPTFVRLMFSAHLIAEGKDFLEAMRESWFITHGLQLPLFGFGILLVLLALSGSLAGGLGLVFTLPLAQCTFAALYNAVKIRMQQ